MKISILSALALFGSAALATAQQASTPMAAQAPTGPVSGMTSMAPMAPLPAAQNMTTINGSGSYGGNYDRNFKEEDLKSKEVSKEIAAPKNGDIYIENTSRNIVIKSWDQQKVKVTTTVYYEGETTKLTDDEWLDKVNLSLKTLGTSVKVKSGTISGSNNTVYYYDSRGNTTSTSGVAIFNGLGQNLGTKSNIKRLVTVYVPAGSKIDVESKYADVTLPDAAGDVNVDIANGNLEGGNLNKLILRSKYSNINVGDLKLAEVEMTNGRFSAKNVDDLDIDSKYSTVEMAAVKKITLRSSNDEYELEEAGEVRGRKNYGNLRVTKLNTSLELDGANADVKVRKVGPSLSMIKIDDKYADVRIPLRDTKNYAIDFAGTYSSVYGNFEKKPVTESSTTSSSSSPDFNGVRVTTARSGSWDSNNPSRFTASVGDGKGLKLDIKCQNCTVDFK